MGKFYIYSSLTPMELYGLADHMDYGVSHSDSEADELRFSVDYSAISIPDAIWNNLLVLERCSPAEIPLDRETYSPCDKVYFGHRFSKQKNCSWAEFLGFLSKTNWARCTSIILDEEYEHLSLARSAVEEYYRAAVKVKGAQEELLGFRKYRPTNSLLAEDK